MFEHLVELCSYPPVATLFVLLAFPLLVACLTLPAGRAGRPNKFAFAALNLVIALVLCVLIAQAALKANYPNGKVLTAAAEPFLMYVALVLLNYVLLRKSKAVGGAWTTAALWTPILMLIVIKYLPIYPVLTRTHLLPSSALNPAIGFLGLSYLSFRLCYVVQEVQNGVVELPNVWDYLSYAFFVPTLVVGPISPYRLFDGSLRDRDRSKTPPGESFLRIIVGLTKYLFFSALLAQFGYDGLLLDGHHHAVIDFVIAVLAYPLYLYANFSGMCDIAVGLAGLIGISVMENFDRPFSSRNFQVFWSRWHISLSTFLREMMFTPLVKFLAQRLGSKKLNHAIAIAIMSVFLVIGVWHGAGLNFAFFGLSQGIGVTAIHYSTAFLRKRLGKEGYAKYQKNGAIYVAACGCTYLYFALTMILFANSWDQLCRIFTFVRW